MSNSEEMIKIGKKLDKMVSNGTTDDSVAGDLLSCLKKFPMTFELLQKSRIGMKVNNFRKACSNENFVSLSKSLIKNWKKLLPDSSSGSQTSSKSTLQRTSSSGSFSAPKDEDSRDSSGNSDNQKPETPTSPSTDKPTLARQTSFPVNADDTTDTIRLKCRELLGNSMKTPPLLDNAQDPDELAAGIEDFQIPFWQDQILHPDSLLLNQVPVHIKMFPSIIQSDTLYQNEESDVIDTFDVQIDLFYAEMSNEDYKAMMNCIFKEFGNTGTKYKTRVRSRVANLRDAKNPALRENVLLGIIPVDRIACMTSDEMASNELKEMRAKFTKQAINDHQMATQSGTKTGLFKCGRCKKRQCTYNQVQTRSADEPMTTFVLCNNCGNRWKFC